MPIRCQAANWLLAKAVERANVQLDDLGLEALPERLTPHSLRRTFASLLVALGEPPTFVMGQLGHEKAEFTLSVYSRQMQRRDGETEGCGRSSKAPSASRTSIASALSGREWAIWPSRGSPTSATQRDRRAKSVAVEGPFRSGRGWVRTSDLSRVRRKPPAAEPS
jgi:hypothetical protein